MRYVILYLHSHLHKENNMRLWEDFKAWRRGEKRIKGATRGRCFVRKEQDNLDGIKRMTAHPTMKLVKMRVIRTDGTIEEIDNG